jgi:DVNP family
MTRYKKSPSGKYLIHGKSFEQLVGSRAQVMHGTAYKTTGDLTADKLTVNKSGRFVSKKKHITAKKENRLVKHGYGSKKGQFGYVKIGSMKKSRKGTKSRGKSRKMRGGTTMPAMAMGKAMTVQ